MEVINDRRGGARRGAGRPRKGQGLRVTMSLSVDPVTLEQARRLRKAGFPLADHIAALVDEKCKWFFNE